MLKKTKHYLKSRTVVECVRRRVTRHSEHASSGSLFASADTWRGPRQKNSFSCIPEPFQQTVSHMRACAETSVTQRANVESVRGPTFDSSVLIYNSKQSRCQGRARKTLTSAGNRPAPRGCQRKIARRYSSPCIAREVENGKRKQTNKISLSWFKPGNRKAVLNFE